jgi:hypothetical protein
MHKKGITEEVAKKRSRRTVKHQRGIVGADLASIQARRNQTAADRLKTRQTAITKAKDEKKAKEAKKDKPKVRPAYAAIMMRARTYARPGCPQGCVRPAGVEAGHEGHQGRPMSVLVDLRSVSCMPMCSTLPMPMVAPCILVLQHALPVPTRIASTVVPDCSLFVNVLSYSQQSSI